MGSIPSQGKCLGWGFPVRVQERGNWPSALLPLWPDNSLLWNCPKQYKIFSRITGFYPLDASSILSTTNCNKPRSLGIAKCVLREKITLGWEPLIQSETMLLDRFKWMHGICSTELQDFLIITLKNECEISMQFMTQCSLSNKWLWWCLEGK